MEHNCFFLQIQSIKIIHCPSWVTNVVMKCNYLKQVGEEVYFVYTSTELSITEGSHDRNSSKAGADLRSYWIVVYISSWIAHLNFIVTVIPGMTPPSMGRTLPHLSKTEKRPHMLVYNQV